MSEQADHGRFRASGHTSAYITGTDLVITQPAGRSEYPLESIHRVVEIDLPTAKKAVAIHLRQKVEKHPGLTFSDPGEATRFCRALREAIGEAAGALRAGMVVAIYQRPLTREEFEGHAELVAKAPGETYEGLQRWAVRFAGENETFRRTIPADEPDRRTSRRGQ